MCFSRSAQSARCVPGTTRVFPRGPTTEKANIKQKNGKRGRWGKEQRESKITPNTTALMPLGVCPSSCASPMYFFHFKCFPFMFTSVQTFSLRLFSRAFPFFRSCQSRAEQFWILPKGNECSWLGVPAPGAQ